MPAPRVVGCGREKTGSTSLARALQTLGYKVRSHSNTLIKLREMGAIWPMRIVATRYDAFRGHPWSRAYREMDSWFPGSKFVLTVREEDTWFDSLARHHARTRGTDITPDRDEWIEGYRRHNEDVQAHFADTDRLLIFDAEAGDGWEKLCSFLGHPEPAVPYPHIASPRAEPGRQPSTR